MPLLDPDSPLMSLKTLSGVHIDAVRCVYDERLNRLKKLEGDPGEQLAAFNRVAADVMAYWQAVAALPEDRVGRRDQLNGSLQRFFERVSRYADFHADGALNEESRLLQARVRQQAENSRLSLLIFPEQLLGR